MKRIFHPYDKWEDYRAGFYGGQEYPTKNTVSLCAEVLADLYTFEKALKVITTEWKHSCEHNLSNESMNRIAYLGQAACALLLKVPNNVSMGAYSTLTVEQQKAADELAQKYLDKWLEANVNT